MLTNRQLLNEPFRRWNERRSMILEVCIMGLGRRGAVIFVDGSFVVRKYYLHKHCHRRHVNGLKEIAHERDKRGTTIVEQGKHYVITFKVPRGGRRRSRRSSRQTPANPVTEV